jgi:hypothetical protein
MNYATQHHIGNYQHTRTETATQLHRQLGEFANWMQRPKDANQVQKDKQKSVPIAMLPMVFKVYVSA